jgi:hypothetical protein
LVAHLVSYPGIFGLLNHLQQFSYVLKARQLGSFSKVLRYFNFNSCRRIH